MDVAYARSYPKVVKKRKVQSCLELKINCPYIVAQLPEVNRQNGYQRIYSRVNQSFEVCVIAK